MVFAQMPDQITTVHVMKSAQSTLEQKPFMIAQHVVLANRQSTELVGTIVAGQSVLAILVGIRSG